MNIERKKNKSAGKTLPLNSDEDLIKIREYCRSLAVQMEFSTDNCTMISTALYEICRNVIDHAGKGTVTIKVVGSKKPCLFITVKDQGPGIKDVQKALEEGFSSRGGLGIGLPGAKRFMDMFEIRTARDEGTTIRMCKYLDKD
nr:anti-sigma regulatory factor [Fodinibius sediminis]